MAPDTTDSVVLKRDDTYDLLNTLKEQVRYERAEKEKYRDLFYRQVGLVESPKLTPDPEAQPPQELPGYKPWSQIRAEMEARHLEMAREQKRKQAADAGSTES